ncbi:MAG: DUF5655 domain-containing protein [Acidimicrobiales bacterium]
MPDPAEQLATQLANIEASSGMTVDDFFAAVSATGLDKHGKILAFLKSDHGLTHGNANLIAHLVRERMAGGPATGDALVDAQYQKGKAALRPIYERLAELALACGDDVTKVAQKTGVSFRRSKQFALVQAPSAKRVQLSLNLDATPPGGRVEPTTGMCNHRVNITAIDDVDDDVADWIRSAYLRAQ